MVIEKEVFYKEKIFLNFSTDIIFELNSTLDKIDYYFKDSDLHEETKSSLEKLQKVSLTLQRQSMGFLNAVFIHMVQTTKKYMKNYDPKKEYQIVIYAKKMVPSLALFIHFIQKKSGVQSY